MAYIFSFLVHTSTINLIVNDKKQQKLSKPLEATNYTDQLKSNSEF